MEFEDRNLKAVYAERERMQSQFRPDAEMPKMPHGMGVPGAPIGLENQVGQSAAGRIAEMAKRLLEATYQLDEARRGRQMAQSNEEQAQTAYCKAHDTLAEALQMFRDGGIV